MGPATQDIALRYHRFWASVTPLAQNRVYLTLNADRTDDDTPDPYSSHVRPANATH